MPNRSVFFGVLNFNSTGADPGFSFRGGGGTKDCARTHITSAEPNSLKGPGSSRVVLMLSRALWALFLSILIKKKLDYKNTVDPTLGGAAPVMTNLNNNYNTLLNHGNWFRVDPDFRRMRSFNFCFCFVWWCFNEFCVFRNFRHKKKCFPWILFSSQIS